MEWKRRFAPVSSRTFFFSPFYHLMHLPALKLGKMKQQDS